MLSAQKSSGVVEYVQKIEAAALRNKTASLWLQSFPSVLCRTVESSCLHLSNHPLIQIQHLAFLIFRHKQVRRQ